MTVERQVKLFGIIPLTRKKPVKRGSEFAYSPTHRWVEPSGDRYVRTTYGVTDSDTLVVTDVYHKADQNDGPRSGWNSTGGRKEDVSVGRRDTHSKENINGIAFPVTSFTPGIVRVFTWKPGKYAPR